MFSSGGPHYSNQQVHPQAQQQGSPQQSELMQWFQAVDQDRSGKISANELRQALAVGNGAQFSLEACELLVKLFDHEHTRMIDFQGFQHLFHFVNQWRAAFATYDTDKSCSIDANELGQALGQMGYRFSPQSVDSIMKKFTSQGTNGKITFDSFIIACVQLHQLTSKYFFIGILITKIC